MRREIISTSSEETERLGRRIGATLKGSEVLQLVSDLGGGKTTLTKGLAVGAGCQDTVSSPTFTLVKEYTGLKVRIKHYDFYRLTDAGIMLHELQEDLTEPNTVIIIEWADIVKNVLPADSVVITMQYTGENERKIVVNASRKLGYLIEAIV